MRDRSRTLTIARAAALFFAVAAVTALVLWTQTREVRRPARVVPPAASAAPIPAPPVAQTPAPTPAVAPTPADAPTPAVAPTPDDRRVYFSTSKAMMAPRLDPPPAPAPAAEVAAPQAPSPAPNGAER